MVIWELFLEGLLCARPHGPPLGTLPSQASRTGTDELGHRFLQSRAESHNHLAGTEGSEGLTVVTAVVSIP